MNVYKIAPDIQNNHWGMRGLCTWIIYLWKIVSLDSAYMKFLKKFYKAIFLWFSVYVLCKFFRRTNLHEFVPNMMQLITNLIYSPLQDFRFYWVDNILFCKHWFKILNIKTACNNTIGSITHLWYCSKSTTEIENIVSSPLWMQTLVCEVVFFSSHISWGCYLTWGKLEFDQSIIKSSG